MSVPQVAVYPHNEYGVIREDPSRLKPLKIKIVAFLREGHRFGDPALVKAGWCRLQAISAHFNFSRGQHLILSDMIDRNTMTFITTKCNHGHSYVKLHPHLSGEGSKVIPKKIIDKVLRASGRLSI